MAAVLPREMNISHVPTDDLEPDKKTKKNSQKKSVCKPALVQELPNCKRNKTFAKNKTNSAAQPQVFGSLQKINMAILEPCRIFVPSHSHWFMYHHFIPWIPASK
jgi:hypothetical protein